MRYAKALAALAAAIGVVAATLLGGGAVSVADWIAIASAVAGIAGVYAVPNATLPASPANTPAAAPAAPTVPPAPAEPVLPAGLADPITSAHIAKHEAPDTQV